MALELAKRQVIYAICKLMEMTDTEYISFYGRSGVKFQHDGIPYEIMQIDRPNIEENDWALHIDAIPSWWTIHHLELTPNNAYVSTLDKLFKVVYKEVYKDAEDESPFDDADSALDILAEDYLEIYEEKA